MLSQDLSTINPFKWGDFQIGYLRPSGDGSELENAATCLSSFSSTKKWKFLKQVHGSKVVEVDSTSSCMQEADGLITSDANCGLAVFGGDCPGLLIDTGDAYFGAAHCGWRGVAGDMVESLVDVLNKVTALETKSWKAIVGPGICGSCYEVDQAVLGAYSWSKESLLWEKGEKAGLDLKSEIAFKLKQLGLSKNQIWVDPCCTYESASLHSYRRSGKGQNQVLAIYQQ